MNWNTNKTDSALIGKITKRAADIAARQGHEYDYMSAMMDITATHANGCPLDLQKLLDAPPFDFTHDIAGIHQHINRQTGELEGCFLPRCALPQPVNA